MQKRQESKLLALGKTEVNKKHSWKEGKGRFAIHLEITGNCNTIGQRDDNGNDVVKEKETDKYNF